MMSAPTMASSARTTFLLRGEQARVTPMNEATAEEPVGQPQPIEPAAAATKAKNIAADTASRAVPICAWNYLIRLPQPKPVCGARPSLPQSARPAPSLTGRSGPRALSCRLGIKTSGIA